MHLDSKPFQLFLAIALTTFTSQIHAQYIAPTGNLSPNNPNTRLVTLNPSMSTQQMQNLISSQPNRTKRVLFTQGTYTVMSLSLSSNTHIRFERGVTIQQSSVSGGNRSGDPIFRVRNATNVSIVGQGGNNNNRTKIMGLDVGEDEESKQHLFSAVSIRDSTNFLINRLRIKGDYTRSNHITTGRNAEQGTIRNIVSTGNSPGFGLYQGFGGSDIVCQNLDGTGGYTLRLEQNAQESQRGFQSPLNNINASNITCRNGRAAVFINPALFTNGGQITADNITAISCGWAVEISAKAPGRVSRITLSNIEAQFGSRGQYREDAAEVRALIPNGLGRTRPITNTAEDGKFITAPSAGLVYVRREATRRTRDTRITIGRNRGRVSFPAQYNRDPQIINEGNITAVANTRP